MAKEEAKKASAKKPAAEGKAEPKKAKAEKAAPVAKAAPGSDAVPADYVPRLRKHYDEVVRPALVKEFGYDNAMQVPKITKIVLNMGVGEATTDSKLVQVAATELEKIAGQKPVITKSRKAIAQFKIRENLAIGTKVTLRKVRMYEFLDRLINRQRQLCLRHQGAHHFPGDRLRQDRSRLGHGRHHLHHGQVRRRGPRADRRLQLPVPQAGPQGRLKLIKLR